ncbi:MAG: DUF5668 domain-containing protein [Acidimicrobiia bacterium]|jgi:hypothetical protein
MTPSQRRTLVSGIVFLALGVMFLLEALGLYELSPTTLWPLLLIALGIGVLSGVGGRTGDRDDR